MATSDVPGVAAGGDQGPVARPVLPTNGQRVREIELHEVKMLNKHLVRLRDEFHLRAEVLVTS